MVYKNSCTRGRARKENGHAFFTLVQEKKNGLTVQTNMLATNMLALNAAETDFGATPTVAAYERQMENNLRRIDIPLPSGSQTVTVSLFGRKNIAY